MLETYMCVNLHLSGLKTRYTPEKFSFKGLLFKYEKTLLSVFFKKLFYEHNSHCTT